MLTIASKPICV